MKINSIALVLLWLLILSSCSKENANSAKGFIIAGKSGNINNTEFKPSKLIQANDVLTVTNGTLKDSVSSSFDYFDFNKNGSFDLCFTSTYGFPNKNSKSVLINTTISGGHTLYITEAPFNENDTISNSQNWIPMLTSDYIVLSISDSFKNDWSTPKYFGYKLTEDNQASWLYGWVKISINDYNQLAIHSYSCAK